LSPAGEIAVPDEHFEFACNQELASLWPFHISRGSAAGRVSRATQALRTQAHTVSETEQQNPGTISSAFVLGGIFGLLIGIVLSQTDVYDRRWS
jgi:hypothetical protein